MAAIAHPFHNDAGYTEVTAKAMNSLAACAILRLSGAIFEHVSDYSLNRKT